LIFKVLFQSKKRKFQPALGQTLAESTSTLGQSQAEKQWLFLPAIRIH